MSDPLSAAIYSAVARALEAQLPKIIEALKAAQPAPATGPDQFVPLPAAAKRLGVHRSTVLRLEASGKLPPRRRVGTKTGYLESDLRSIVGADDDAPKRKRKGKA